MDRRYRLHHLGDTNGRTYSIVVQNQYQVKTMMNSRERVNYLLIEALERYHHYYGDGLQVECPTGSGKKLNLQQVADDLRCRLARLFLRDERGRRPCHGEDSRYAENPHWRDLVLFYEYFHGETGQGLGASHQTGWTALVIRLLENIKVGESFRAEG